MRRCPQRGLIGVEEVEQFLMNPFEGRRAEQHQSNGGGKNSMTIVLQCQRRSLNLSPLHTLTMRLRLRFLSGLPLPRVLLFFSHTPASASPRHVVTHLNKVKAFKIVPSPLWAHYRKAPEDKVCMCECLCTHTVCLCVSVSLQVCALFLLLSAHYLPWPELFH